MAEGICEAGQRKERVGFQFLFTNAPGVEVFRWRRKISFIVLECYRPYTGFVQSRGPENIGLQRKIPAAASKSPVQSHLRITLENNGKIRPQPDPENAFARASGGATGTAV
jgi:hypothetical protein